MHRLVRSARVVKYNTNDDDDEFEGSLEEIEIDPDDES